MQLLKLIRYEKLYETQGFLTQDLEGNISTVSTAYPKKSRSAKQCIYLQLLLMSFCHLYEDLDKTALLANGPVPLLHTVVLFTQVS